MTKSKSSGLELEFGLVFLTAFALTVAGVLIWNAAAVEPTAANYVAVALLAVPSCGLVIGLLALLTCVAGWLKIEERPFLAGAATLSAFLAGTALALTANGALPGIVNAAFESLTSSPRRLCQMIAALTDMWAVWGGLVLFLASGAVWLVRKRLHKDDPEQLVWDYYWRNFDVLGKNWPPELVKLHMADSFPPGQDERLAREKAKIIIRHLRAFVHYPNLPGGARPVQWINALHGWPK